MGSFKVVDRRSFTTDGELREGVDVESTDAEETVPTENVSVESTPSTPNMSVSKTTVAPVTSESDVVAEPAINAVDPKDDPFPFGVFIQSLAQQAMIQLGLMGSPNATPRLDLEGARDTIDILSMLKIRTDGNLTVDEVKILDQLLYELRMTYVEITKKIQNASMPPPPGSQS